MKLKGLSLFYRGTGCPRLITGEARKLHDASRFTEAGYDAVPVLTGKSETPSQKQ